MSEIRYMMQEYLAMGLYFRHKAIELGVAKVKPWHNLSEEEMRIWLDDAKMCLDFKAEGRYAIAVVDREAELPEWALSGIGSKTEKAIYRVAQQDMLKAGWIKEVKD